GVTRTPRGAPYASSNPEPGRWTVESDGPGGHANLYADRPGPLSPPTPEPAGPPRIVIRAVAGETYGLLPVNPGTWIRLIDPDQSVRFDGTLKPGDSYRVPGIPGIRLQTGKPETLAVSLDDRPAR